MVSTQEEMQMWRIAAIAILDHRISSGATVLDWLISGWLGYLSQKISVFK